MANERIAAALVERPEVPETENPLFRTHPRTDLESRIDAFIAANGDPAREDSVRYLARTDEGEHYGTVNIRLTAAARKKAYRGNA